MCEGGRRGRNGRRGLSHPCEAGTEGTGKDRIRDRELRGMRALSDLGLPAYDRGAGQPDRRAEGDPVPVPQCQGSPGGGGQQAGGHPPSEGKDGGGGAHLGGEASDQISPGLRASADLRGDGTRHQLLSASRGRGLHRGQRGYHRGREPGGAGEKAADHPDRDGDGGRGGGAAEFSGEDRHQLS